MFLKSLLKRENEEDFYKFYLAKTPSWLALEINKKRPIKYPFHLHIELDHKNSYVAQGDSKSSIQSFELRYKNTKKSSKKPIKNPGEFVPLLTQKIFADFKEHISQTLPTKKPIPGNGKNALKWLDLSSQLLANAVNEKFTKGSEDFLFEAQVFMGHHPKHQTFEIRIILFNTDFLFRIIDNSIHFLGHDLVKNSSAPAIDQIFNNSQEKEQVLTKISLLLGILNDYLSDS